MAQRVIEDHTDMLSPKYVPAGVPPPTPELDGTTIQVRMAQRVIEDHKKPVEGLYTPNYELLFVDSNPCMQHELRRLADFSRIYQMFLIQQNLHATAMTCCSLQDTNEALLWF